MKRNPVPIMGCTDRTSGEIVKTLILSNMWWDGYQGLLAPALYENRHESFRVNDELENHG